MAGTNVGSLFVEIGAKIDGLKSGLKESESLMNKTAETAKNMGTGVQTGMDKVSGAVNVVGLIAKSLVTAKAIDMVADGMADMVNSARRWGDTIDTMGDQFGMSGKEASKWAVAMGHVGLSVTEGSMQLNYFTKQLADAAEAQAKGESTSSGFADALSKLGVSATNARGGVRSFNELMPEIMDAFSRLPAGIESSSIAMELFGARGGTKFLDFLRQGSAGLDEATLKAQQFGLAMDSIQSDKIEQLGFKVNDLGMAFEGLKVSIGIGLLGPLDGAIGLLNTVASGLAVFTNGDALEKWNAIVEYSLYGRKTDYLMRQITPQPGTYTGVGAVRAADAANMSPGTTSASAASILAEEAWAAKMDADKSALLASEALLDWQRRRRESILGIGTTSSTSGYGGASSFGATSAAASMGFNDYLAATFPDIGAAQEWMGAFSSQHGGRAATQVDLRDKMAGDAFAAKYGRAATQSEWEQRYYKGSFEGMEGEEAGLDKIFGPNGTLTAKMEEKNKADADNWAKLLDAFAKAKDPTYSVQIVGRRITD
jgi:hypothetical protein